MEFLKKTTLIIVITVAILVSFFSASALYERNTGQIAPLSLHDLRNHDGSFGFDATVMGDSIRFYYEPYKYFSIRDDDRFTFRFGTW
jgi:hypothetical protein